MKKWIYGIGIISTFIFGSAAYADYVIKLKNGRNVEVEKYWEEKDAIKFQYQGGVASLPKKNILSIVKVEEKFSERTYKQKEPSPTPREIPEEPKKTEVKEIEKPAALAETSKAIDVEYYKKQKAHYTEQFEQAHQRYLEATSRRDEEAKKKAWEEFNNFGGKVVSMEAELMKKNNGVVPPWWKE